MNPIQPPKWPQRCLRFFVKKEYLEEIEGDMEEMFFDHVETFSAAKARRIYAWETLKLIRPSLMKNVGSLQFVPQAAMFGNYLKVSIRGLMRHPLNSFINIFGLSVAIGVCIFSYAFARYTYRIDQFHENKNTVYLTTFFSSRNGTAQQYGTTPRPLGQMLREDFAQIKNVCRIDDRNVVVKVHDHVFHERMRFADPEFLDMFTFPLKWGNPGSLADVNSVILSEDMAVKYFGLENPVGRSLLVKFDQNRNKLFTVTGVAEKFPQARTFGFDFLVHFKNLRTADPGFDVHDWKSFVRATFIQVDHPADLVAIQAGMEKYRRLQTAAVQDEGSISDFAFEPLATLHERSGDIRDDISRSSEAESQSVIYLFFIGGLLLALACFNYINIAIVSTAKRLREIGVRKTMGASVKTVVVQFLAENVVITSFALGMGLIIGIGVFIRGFEYLWRSFSLDFSLTDPVLWIYLPAILVITSLASGIYPSLYISRFQVVGILKGSVRFGKKNPLTKALLGCQLVFSCLFLTGAVMFTQNSSYLAHRSWGYHPAETLYAAVPDRSAFEQLSARMIQESDVLSVSGSAHHLGKNHETVIVNVHGREYEVDRFSVGARYFETMGLDVKEGRAIEDHEGSDRRSVLVNEQLAKTLNWKNPVGQNFKIDNESFEVIGVVRDFHSYNFARQIRPVIFTAVDKSDYRYLSMKVRAGSEAKMFKILQANWASLFPETPFAGGHQEDVWGFYFEEIKIHGIVWRVFGFLAVSLTGLGLYGLIRLNIAGRTKEFSIRKVLGAGLQHLVGNVSRQYVLLFSAALIIGAPASHVLAKLLIETSYTYHMPIDGSSVMIAVAILIMVVAMTVSSQVGRVMKTNPVQGLKVE